METCLRRQRLLEPDERKFSASFRKESSRLVSGLVRALGPSRLPLVEDVVQESFLRALQSWSISGPPPNPSAWLTLTAKRLAIDALRREKIYSSDCEALLDRVGVEDSDPTILGDAELEMLFLCCHPSLPLESQVALTLRELCGLSTREVAKGLLLSEDAVAQRLVRAKKALTGVEWLGGSELVERLESVLRVIYLMFNEGYSAHTDPELVRSELCDEAILLANRLSKTGIGDRPDTRALLALMLFHSSRLPARVSPDGSLCLLEDQDRSLWDRARIHEGVKQLSLAARGPEASQYHFEAGIAATHALSPSFKETDWACILRIYDDLAAVNPTPVVLLNRAIALAVVFGPEAGIEQIEAIEDSKQLTGYYLLPATKAKFCEMLGEAEMAKAEYEKALKLAQNPCEVAFLERKLGM